MTDASSTWPKIIFEESEVAAAESALEDDAVVASVLVMALSAAEAEAACGRAEAPTTETSASNAAAVILSINVRIALLPDHGTSPSAPSSG